MNTPIPQKWMRPLDAVTWSLLGAALTLLIAVFIGGCERENLLTQPTNLPEVPPLEFEARGEDFLISALDEVHAIADWTNAIPTGLSERSEVPLSGIPLNSGILKSGTKSTVEMSIPPASGRDLNLPQRENKLILSKSATDTVYIYGEVTPEGYGAVVTERYSYPKGLLLITVRKSHGKENGRIVTQTKRYISYADLQNDNPQQTNVTELYGLAADTIVTHVLRNGTLETFTFRLPVITRVVNPQDGSIRITTRYGANGYVISEVRDGNGNLIQLRRSNGQAEGSLVTRTEFPDSSWRQVRTVGQADGTILREVTSSLGPSSSVQQAAVCECLCGCGEDIRECKTCGCTNQQ
jgi:hypothetical protein